MKFYFYFSEFSYTFVKQALFLTWSQTTFQRLRILLTELHRSAYQTEFPTDAFALRILRCRTDNDQPVLQPEK